MKTTKKLKSWWANVPEPKWLRFALLPIYVPLIAAIDVGERAETAARYLLDWVEEISDRHDNPCQ